MDANERGFRIPLEALLAYSDNCRALLQETLSANGAVFDRQIQPPLVRFRTVRQIAAHMVGAEEFWIRHRIMKEELTRYETRAADSVEGLFADWETVRGGTRRYIGSLNPEGLQRLYRVTLGGDWTGDLSVEQILFHILNHETHHRSQISMALQQFGIDPPDFDFVLMK